MKLTDTLDWKKLESTYGEDLILFKPRFDQMQHPVSGAVMRRLVLESVDWVNCVAIDTEGQLIMVRQYRFGSGSVTLETPGGMVDPGEDSGTAARRELLEETGYGGGSWRYLGAVQPNPAIHNHLCHHWLGTDLEPKQVPDLGPGEHIHLDLMSPEAVITAARQGEIRHVLALSALCRVLNIWPSS